MLSVLSRIWTRVADTTITITPRAYLSIYLMLFNVYMYVHLPVLAVAMPKTNISLCICIYLLICMSVYLPAYFRLLLYFVSIYLTVDLSQFIQYVYMSVGLSVCLSIYLSISVDLEYAYAFKSVLSIYLSISCYSIYIYMYIYLFWVLLRPEQMYRSGIPRKQTLLINSISSIKLDDANTWEDFKVKVLSVARNTVVVRKSVRTGLLKAVRKLMPFLKWNVIFFRTPTHQIFLAMQKRGY